MNIFVFDIETIPDYDTASKLYGFHDLNPAEVVTAMQHLRREKTGNEFLPHHLQRIVAISVVLRTQDKLKVWSLGELDSSEAEVIGRFFKGIDRYTPTLVSWNGSGFDLPVLHYRAMLHHISAPRYWEAGQEDSNFRYNNYLSRYHYRHSDLMDILASYSARANAPLDEIAMMLGFPGKMGMDGSQVWECYLRGELAAIRNYCETDVLNTYLVFLRFELMRGQLTREKYEEECQLLKNYLGSEQKPHLNEFLTLWNERTP